MLSRANGLLSYLSTILITLNGLGNSWHIGLLAYGIFIGIKKHWRCIFLARKSTTESIGKYWNHSIDEMEMMNYWMAGYSLGITLLQLICLICMRTFYLIFVFIALLIRGSPFARACGWRFSNALWADLVDHTVHNSGDMTFSVARSGLVLHDAHEEWIGDLVWGPVSSEIN